MQAELEKWIEENKVMAHIFNEHGEHMVPLNALRALLAGKVLCDAEPVAWMNPNDWIAYTTRQEGDRPLYAAASPLGNADIGKEAVE
jgi:hypothetical protein